jgi:tRNA (adenine22-N1)-methyltransferase
MSRRLHTIADLTPEGARVADIGTDHARLLPLLVTRRRAPLAIGIDRALPLAFARRTLCRTDPAVRAHIDLREGDGLAPLAPREVDTIVIAGMGARSIIAILGAHPDRAREATTIILQPATETGRLRTWLASHDFAITQERVATERSRTHIVLAVTPVPAGHLARPGPRS